MVGLSTILITLADSYSQMIVFVVFYGFCDGCFITTLNVILLTTVEGAKRPASLGWNMQVASIFMGSGPPIAGKNVTLQTSDFIRRHDRSSQLYTQLKQLGN